MMSNGFYKKILVVGYIVIVLLIAGFSRANQDLDITQNTPLSVLDK